MEWLFAMQRYCKWATVNAKGVYLTKSRQNWYGMLSAKIQSIRFSTLVRKHLMQEKIADKLIMSTESEKIKERWLPNRVSQMFAPPLYKPD